MSKDGGGYRLLLNLIIDEAASSALCQGESKSPFLVLISPRDNQVASFIVFLPRRIKVPVLSLLLYLRSRLADDQKLRPFRLHPDPEGCLCDQH